MKLSLSWICEHISGTSFDKVDVPALVERFNLTTAEIEQYRKIEFDWSLFTVARLVQSDVTSAVLFSEEQNTTITVSAREDLQIGQLFILKKQKKDWDWAKLSDWGGSKDDPIAAIALKPEAVAGLWKKNLPTYDYVLELSNTSITHRPDLWSHRGVAREIAALCGYSLVPERHFLADIPVIEDEKNGQKVDKFSIHLGVADACKRFSVFSVPSIAYTASSIPIAVRLALVDAKPIDAIVDATNYVMFDFGEPMHAFDAEKLTSGQFGPSMAHNGQSLSLLDGETIELSDSDLVIMNAANPVALAGVMGGQLTKVTSTTKTVLLEAGCFNATIVRNAALRHKRRTEGSTRFEKGLDPSLTVKALQRCITLLSQSGIIVTTGEAIVSIGSSAAVRTIVVSGDLIDTALGVPLTQDFITQTLTSLGMKVTVHTIDAVCQYSVEIPSYRLKDLQIPEDIIEELGRFYGYTRIPQVLPSIQAVAIENPLLADIAALKRMLAFSVVMHEVHNYPMYDEDFLKEIGYVPDDAVGLKNPVSDSNWRLVTSLVPHLFKNIKVNKAHPKELRFFEYARVWHKKGELVDEQKKVTAIIVQQKDTIDFYAAKEAFSSLFEMFKVTVLWQKSDTVPLWFHPYKTAQLIYGDIPIGYAGMVHPRFCKSLDIQDAFLFDLDIEIFLGNYYKASSKLYTPLARYQDSWFDVSAYVAKSVTVAQLQELIGKQDSRIFKTDLIDFFQKDDWPDKRSITIRTFVRDTTKTLVKAEIDQLYAQVVRAIEAVGAEVR